jgi:DNA polymerase III subunit delta
LPSVSSADVRKQIVSGRVEPLYLLIGPDEAEKTSLAGRFVELVDEGLRAFNVERLYGGETSAESVVDAAKTLPMMSACRVVLLLHADRLLMPKRETDATNRDLDVLEAYIRAPVDTSCLILVAETLDRRRSLTKLLLTKAAVVECVGPIDVAEATRWVRDRVADEGMSIDPRAAKLVAERTGPDIRRLRADVGRLVLYAANKQNIDAEDVLQVVGAATAQDDWAVTRAIERRAPAEALRELALLMDAGAVPYMILGQLAWFVRTKTPASKLPGAVEAVFRTDLAIKSSAGDPRVLLERLVVELCGR